MTVARLVLGRAGVVFEDLMEDRYGKRHPRACGGFSFIRRRDGSTGPSGRLLSGDALGRLLPICLAPSDRESEY